MNSITQTATKSKRERTVTHGTCYITHGQPTLEADLEAGSAILCIRPEKGGWADYWLARIRDGRGRIVGYRLEKFLGHPEDCPVIYEIDCSFGGGWAWANCSCPDAVHRRTAGLPLEAKCKHLRAIAAALARKGIYE